MSPERLQGLVSLGASAFLYKKMTALTLLFGGPVVPIVGVVGTAMFGMARFNNANQISAISMVDSDHVELTI